MQQVGVIINPGSHRNKSSIEALERVVAAAPNAQGARLDDFAELPRILADFARCNIDVVTVAGGDGSVQAVLTLLFRDRPFDKTPLLAVLPRGMTNMISDDVGLLGRGAKGLTRLLAAAKGSELGDKIVTRRILRMENARDTPPQYGMFFGGAGIYRAIEVCRDQVHPYKFSANAAAAFTLAGAMGRWLIGGGGQNKIFKGDRIDVTLDGQEQTSRAYLMILATTLDKLVLGSKPFWGENRHHLRYTAIDYPPRRLLRNALKVLYGGPRRQFGTAGYHSHGSDRIELVMQCPFTLDGELFAPMPDRPLILTADDEASFVQI